MQHGHIIAVFVKCFLVLRVHNIYGCQFDRHIFKFGDFNASYNMNLAFEHSMQLSLVKNVNCTWELMVLYENLFRIDAEFVCLLMYESFYFQWCEVND